MGMMPDDNLLVFFVPITGYAGNANTMFSW